MNGKSFELLFFGFGDENYPYTRISHEILIEASNENEVSAYFVKSESIDFINKKIKIKQCPNLFNSKALTYLSYSVFCFFHILKTFLIKPNVCFIVPTTPPFVLPFILSIAKVLTFGKLKWVYHVQDIHPEISFVGKTKTFVYNLLKQADTYFINNANAVITLSNEMRGAINSRENIKSSPINVVNNFVEDFKFEDRVFDFISKDKAQGKILFIFSGNVGKFQRVAEVTKFFLDTKHFNGVLYILGDGEEIPAIKELLDTHVNKSRVRLLGRKPFLEANIISSQCDYGIVSLNPEITKYAYPSKFATYISMGLKVLAFVDNNSQISTEIAEYNIGNVINNLTDFNKMMLHASKLNNEERNRIQSISKSLFDKDALVIENVKFLEDVSES
jgi:hypothetical protein